MVMEKSRKSHGTRKIGQTSWNFVISHRILQILPSSPRIVPNCFGVTTKILSSDLESLHFPMFSAKRRKCKIVKRDDLGKSRNGHGQIFCQVCGNPDK